MEIALTILATLIVSAVLIMWYGKSSREAEVAPATATPAGTVHIKDAIMVMAKIFTADNKLLDEMPLYLVAESELELNAKMNQWITRAYTCGYIMHRPSCGDVITYPPHSLGNIIWKVQSWGALEEKTDAKI